MMTVILVFNSMLVLFLACMLIRSQQKIRMLCSRMEEMSMEQSKFNFRLFVVEKKQKLFYEKKIV